MGQYSAEIIEQQRKLMKATGPWRLAGLFLLVSVFVGVRVVADTRLHPSLLWVLSPGAGLVAVLLFVVIVRLGLRSLHLHGLPDPRQKQRTRIPMNFASAAMLSGPTAYRLTIVRLVVTAALLLWFLAWILVLFVLPRIFFQTTSIRVTLIAGLFVMTLAAGSTAFWQISKREREFKAGYTTLINLRTPLDVRDPENGHILLRAGDRFPKDSMSLTEARQFAAAKY